MGLEVPRLPNPKLPQPACFVALGVAKADANKLLAAGSGCARLEPFRKAKTEINDDQNLLTKIISRS